MLETARILPFGERALLIESPAPADLLTQQHYHRLRQDLLQLNWISQVVTGFNNLTVFIAPELVDLMQAQQYLRELLAKNYRFEPQQATAARLHRIAVRYGGAHGVDLCDLAQYAGLTAEQVIALHTSQRYTVYCLGFQPGFAYLGDLKPALHRPRRAEPRLSVPAGSVAIGGSQTGIYPSASPGGWHLIGQTDCRLFDIQADPPCLLQAGDQVEFYPV